MSTLNAGIRVIALVGLSACAGCTSDTGWRVENRQDNSKALIPTSVDALFPTYAAMPRVNASVQPLNQAPAASVTADATLHSLYEQADQVNRQIRDFLIINYLVYVNAELEVKEDARQKGRNNLLAMQERLQTLSLALRDTRGALNDVMKQYATSQPKLTFAAQSPVAPAVAAPSQEKMDKMLEIAKRKMQETQALADQFCKVAPAAPATK